MMNHITDSIKNKYKHFRGQQILNSSKYLKALQDIPPILFAFWQQTADSEFNGIPQDAVFFIRSTEGLMMFFDCVRHSNKPCGLPSKAADSVWHAWINLPQAAFGAKDVESFCLKHFGRTIPHIEAAHMQDGMEAALANTLVKLRIAEGRDPTSLVAPKLFTLDRRLSMPNGYAYRIENGKLGFQTMNHNGRAVGKSNYPLSFMAIELLALGLISENVFEQYQRKQVAQMASNQGGGCGTGSIDSSSSCDGGGDGGSSCGGGCGGGCGGS